MVDDARGNDAIPAELPATRRSARRVSVAAGTLVAAAVVALLGWLDDLTGADYSLALLYLLPVVGAGWFLGRGPGVLIALLASASWLSDEIRHHPVAALAIAWNGGSRLVILIAAAFVSARLRRDREQARRHAVELRRLARGEARLARTDPLTGLRNRRAFEELVTAEIARCQRSGKPFCVALLDLDDFKRVNDSLGHEEGDALLMRVAERLRESARTADIPARLGGDEFALLLWAVAPPTARRIAERLLERVSASAGHGVGVSVGVAHFTRAPREMVEALRRADAAMYEAKRGGKGRVVVWTDSDLPAT